MEATCLKDPDVYPGDEVLSVHLGRAMALWGSFVEAVRSRSASLEWKYYRDGMAWLGKVVERKNTICWISIWPKHFKATFYFGSKNDAEIAGARISETLKEAFLQGKPASRFRPLVVAVRNRPALADALELMQLKARLR